jgi:glucokinase
MLIVAGDVGGTHTRLSIFDGKKVVKEKKYLSKQFSGLSEILQDFLTEKVERGCFGIAGPVTEGRCQATNLPWKLDASEISKNLKISQVWLINDLEATAWGVSCLNESQLLVLNQGQPQKGNQAVIAAGTGLGEAGLYWDGKAHHPFACEGGHVNFAPRDDREKNFLNYLHKKYGHVSYERVLSGPGLEHLYRFLVENGAKEDCQEGDTPALVTDRALSGQSNICVEVVNWFVSIYGSEAGNLALKFLAVGGIYIAGGIALKITEFLKNGMFMQSFCDKGRFKTLLSTIPVKVILTDDAALLGAAEYARRVF